MKMVKMLCALIAAALMLPIAAAEPAPAAMGRYLETPLRAPGAGMMSFTQANGSTYAVGWDGEALYQSEDMDAWRQTETGHDDAVAPAKSGVNGLMIGEDGALYLSSGWAMVDEKGRPYLERIEAGASRKIQLDRKLPRDTDKLEVCLLPGGEFIALGDHEAYRFSAEGATVQRYAVPNSSALAVYGGEMAVLSIEDAQIRVLDIASGQETRALNLPVKASRGLLGYDAEGALYFVCPEGIYRVNAGGTLLLQIVDGKLATLGRPNAVASELLFDGENNPVVAYWDIQSQAALLVAYRFDAGTPTEPSTVLSVFALRDSNMLREWASRFQQEHPDVMVDIVVALPEEAAITRDDAIRTLNTELLAGKGPDVLVLDGLPLKSYIEKGVLADLTPALRALTEAGELAENLMGAYRQDGTLPAVPTRFLLPTLWGETEGIQTLSDMAAWAQAHPEALPYYALDAESLIGTFYLSCAPAWFTEDGWLDESAIADFLQALSAIRGDWTYEAYVQKTGFDIRAAWQESGMAIPEWNPYHAAAGWSSLEESVGESLLLAGLQKQVPYLLRGAHSISNINGQMKTGDFAPLPGQAEGCFLPTLILGASKGNRNSETAGAFIAYTLRAESQTLDMREGFPVNVLALDALQAEDDRDGRLSSWGGSTMTEESWQAKWLNKAQCDQWRAIVDGLKTPVPWDFTLYQMLVQESAPFLAGQISAEQAAANVCAKANAYLSE